MEELTGDYIARGASEGELQLPTCGQQGVAREKKVNAL